MFQLVKIVIDNLFGVQTVWQKRERRFFLLVLFVDQGKRRVGILVFEHPSIARQNGVRRIILFSCQNIHQLCKKSVPPGALVLLFEFLLKQVVLLENLIFGSLIKLDIGLELVHVFQVFFVGNTLLSDIV